MLYVYTKDADGKIHSRRDMGVFFIPMTGAMMKLPPPKAAPMAQATPAGTLPEPATMVPADAQDGAPKE